MRKINYARLPECNIVNHLKYEILSTSFYPTKDDYFRKCKKSEL